MAPRSTFTVHKLVTRAFIGPIPKGFCVNHKNGVKTDNRLTNLEYVTRSDNNLDWRRREGRRGAPIQRRATTQAKGEDHGMAKLSQKQVFRIHRLFASGLLRREISDKTGISYWVVRNIISGRAWIHLHPEYQF